MSEIYGEQFFKEEGSHNFKSSEIVAPLVIDLIHPRTMIDVGCGAAPWAKSFQTRGVNAFGIDGDYVDRKLLLIDEKKFIPQDLESRFNLDKRLDLAVCLEVAEHLSPVRAETFVEDLVKISDVVLFSAAIAGQSGTHHVNCQFQSYWANIFKKFDYVPVDYLRPKIWNDTRINVIYRQNMFFYVYERSLSKYPVLFDFYCRNRDSQILNLVHPEFYMLYMDSMINQIVSLRNAINTR